MSKSIRKSKSGTFSEEALNKILSSGLTAEQAMALGMYSVGNAGLLHKAFDDREALVIPYHTVSGAPAKAHPTWPDFYRVRYLGANTSFKAMTDGKPRRYTQPPDTGICAYFPNLVDWQAIASDINETVLITEGEFKAAKATACGFPTIGLGGVYNFRSSKQGIFFLPELEMFKWPRRAVYIVYDSDYRVNANVCAAINALAEELSERGAIVSVVTLDDVYAEEERKTGLDDFLVERGEDALVKLIKSAEPLAMTRRLWHMNEEVLYVSDPGFVVTQSNGQKIPVSNFTAHSDWATASVPERKVLTGGGISMVKASAASAWIKWPLRQRVDKLSYKPGAERYYTEKNRKYYNTWNGWGVEPRKGSVEPFIKLFNFVFEGLTKQEKDWLLDWMAYPIINPGAKLFQAVIVHGRKTGTGKTFIGYTLGRIYGENFTKIKNENLHETWWAENRQFVLGDEISGSDKRSDMDLMKTMITQEEITINIKFIPQFTIPDCVNYYLTSQHADALWLEDEDRRFFVHEVTQDEPLPIEFYQAYEHWLDNVEGAAALMHWLQQRNVKEFKPKGAAPRTAARARMINMGKSDVDAWCADLKANPQNILRIGKLRHVRDLFTSKELLEMYLRDNEMAAGKVTAGGITRAMSKAGFKQAYDGMPIATDDGKQGRYFVVRNAARWLKITNKRELVKHIALQPVNE